MEFTCEAPEGGGGEKGYRKRHQVLKAKKGDTGRREEERAFAFGYYHLSFLLSTHVGGGWSKRGKVKALS